MKKGDYKRKYWKVARLSGYGEWPVSSNKCPYCEALSKKKTPICWHCKKEVKQNGS